MTVVGLDTEAYATWAGLVLATERSGTRTTGPVEG
jgi:hypothetical protein